MEVETQAVSSSAEQQENASLTVEELSGEQRAEWLKTGNLPVKPQAESAPAPNSEDATDKEESERASASEAEPTQEAPKPKRSNAETRIKELLAEKKRLETELADARRPKDAKTAESSPAKPAEAKPQTSEAPKKPKMEEFDTIEAYEDAKDKYYEDLADYKAAKAVEKAQRDAEEKAQLRAIQDRYNEAKSRYEDYDAVAGPAYKGVMSEGVNQAVQAVLSASPYMTDLLYVIGGAEDGGQAFVELAKTDPIAAIRKVAQMEVLVEQELSKGGSAEATRNDKGQFTGSPEKKFSSAPKPADEVSAQTGTPGDEAQAALDRGDMTAYRRIMNARDLKQRGL